MCNAVADTLSRQRLGGRHPRFALLVTSLSALAALTLSGCTTPDAPLLEKSAVALRDHVDIRLPANDDHEAQLIPVVIARNAPLAFCLAAAPTTDTSQWQLKHWFVQQDGHPLRSDEPHGGPEAALLSGFAAPTSRMGATLCFDVPMPTHLRAGNHQLCASLRDIYDQRSQALGCRVVHFVETDPVREAHRDRLNQILASVGRIPADELSERLQRLAQQLPDYPLLQLRVRLVDIYFLRRSGIPALVEQARAGLRQRPAWLQHPDASGWAAQLNYEAASLALDQDLDFRLAWQHLRQAEARYAQVAHPKLFTVVMKQTEVLARVGAASEARERLSAALADCDTASCEPSLLPAARNTLAWWILLDNDASAQALDRAGRIVRESLAAATGQTGQPHAHPLERANMLINLGYHATRVGASPAEHLAQARALLPLAPDSTDARASRLHHWANLVEVMDAFSRGEYATMHALAARVAQQRTLPRLAAWAFSYIGQAQRLQGQLSAAASAFDTALTLHQHAGAEHLGQAIALGPGQRADDFYRAARLAVQRERPEQAWQLLDALDQLHQRLAQQPCQQNQLKVAQQRDDLLGQLIELQAPAAGPRQQQRASIRRTILDQLQELLRGQCAQDVSATRRQPDFRAFALEDEILLLGRTATRPARLLQRTAMPRKQLLAIAHAVQTGMQAPLLTDASWRALLAPVANALVPPAKHLQQPTARFALHGALQRFPVAALPLPSTSSPARWLADITAPVIQPAMAAGATMDSATPGHGLFVVDPSGNLATANRSQALYQALFPTARVLREGAATPAAVREALVHARFLHVDAHASFNPAFPELSRITLAGGQPVLAAALARLPSERLTFANLSACESGRWPVSADSGHYGIGGYLVAQTTPWVIATRTLLADALAGDFNAAFYPQIAAGLSPPEAYAQAHAAVRNVHPAASWAALMLLGHGQGGAIASAVDSLDNEASLPDKQ